MATPIEIGINEKEKITRVCAAPSQPGVLLLVDPIESSMITR